MSVCDELIRKGGEYLPREDLDFLAQACSFAGQIYTGQHRLSGLPYMTHALAVAEILIQLKLDPATDRFVAVATTYRFGRGG